MAQELTLLYFAEVARKTGTRVESFPFREGATLSELQRELFEKYPQLKPMSKHLVWSVDEEIAGGETRLFASQRVGVMPPFSGG